MNTISRSDYPPGHGVKCPNWKRCGEDSLSLSFAISMSEVDNTFPILHCFQCRTPLGRLSDD